MREEKMLILSIIKSPELRTVPGTINAYYMFPELIDKSKLCAIIKS